MGLQADYDLETAEDRLSARIAQEVEIRATDVL
jgi:hypothetical protein